MNKAEQLIACLEGEIAKRDARIVELESGLIPTLDRAAGYREERDQLRAELSAIKAQGVVMLGRDAIREVFMRNGFTIKEGQADLKPYVYAAAEELLRLAAPVQQVSVPDEREAFEREAVERYGYTWASIYSRRQGLGYSDSSLCMAWIMWQARAMLTSSPAAPAADARLTESEWTKDADEWGGALNHAAWEFINECPEKSALLFNNTKGPLRAAIMKYAEIVAAHRAAPAPGGE